MPYMLVQLEEALEPLVERFNRLAATAIKPPAATAVQERLTLLPSPPNCLDLGRQAGVRVEVGGLVIAWVGRAQKTLPRSSTILITFDAITMLDKHCAKS